MRRTIMIFPEFENSHLIDGIRAKYDPLANLVKPHITLVFPFEASCGNETIERALDRCLSDIEPFKLKVKGIGSQKGSFGNYLFLNIVNGEEEIRKIHDILIANDFKRFDMGFEYAPHITVGKLPSKELLDEAVSSLEGFDEEFVTTVRKVSVEMIGENEESIIIIEKRLGAKGFSEEKINFGTATREDIDELVRLRLAYIREDFGSLSAEDEADMREQLPDYFARKLGADLVAFVARDGDKLIAAAYLLIIEKPSNPMIPGGLAGEVLSVYTEEEYRGKGICSRLIKDLVDYGRVKGLDRIDLKATKDGYPVYERQGFKESKSHYTPMSIDLR